MRQAILGGNITLEDITIKAQNYADFLQEPVKIYVYNDKAPGVKGHHILETLDMDGVHSNFEEFTFVKTIDPK